MTKMAGCKPVKPRRANGAGPPTQDHAATLVVAPSHLALQVTKLAGRTTKPARLRRALSVSRRRCPVRTPAPTQDASSNTGHQLQHRTPAPTQDWPESAARERPGPGTHTEPARARGTISGMPSATPNPGPVDTRSQAPVPERERIASLVGRLEAQAARLGRLVSEAEQRP